QKGVAEKAAPFLSLLRADLSYLIPCWDLTPNKPLHSESRKPLVLCSKTPFRSIHRKLPTPAEHRPRLTPAGGESASRRSGRRVDRRCGPARFVRRSRYAIGCRQRPPES